MPRVKTTPMVKLALYGLRIYLIVLLGLILLKFIRTYVHPVQTPAPTTTSAPASREAVPGMPRATSTFEAEK